MTRLRLSLAGAVFTAVLSCGGSDAATGPDNSTVASLSLSESAISVQVGFSHQISASPRSASGAALTGIQITWSSNNPAVALVTDGSISALQTGTATITASAGGKTAAATVTAVPTVVVSVQLSRSNATLAPGRTTVLTAAPLDAIGRNVPGRAVSFSSSDKSVATVTSTGIVSAVAPGTAQISATADAQSSALSLFVVLPTAISIPLKVGQPAGSASLSSYQLTLRDDDDSISVTGAVGTAGTLTGAMALADSVQFVARGDPGSSSASLPSSLTAPRNALPASVPVVLIPQAITLTSGTFAGSSFFVNPAAAVAPCATKSDQCLNGFYGQEWKTGVKGWPSFPVGVQAAGVSSGDSATIWASLRAMETAFGKSLFTPAGGTVPVGITVIIGLPPQCAEFAGCANWAWDGSDRLTTATVWLSTSAIASRATVQHEFLHALGFWHTCSWPSVMGGYGCAQATQITSGDVAYVTLAAAVQQVETGFRLPGGALPCGSMGIWAAVPGQHISVACDGDAFQVPSDPGFLRSTRIIGLPSGAPGSDWAK